MSPYIDSMRFATSAATFISFWENVSAGQFDAALRSAPGTLRMQHVIIPLNCAFSRAVVGFSNSTSTGTASLSLGVYTLTGTTLSLLTSASGTTAWTAALNQLVTMAPGASTTLAASEYYIGIVHATNAANTSNGLWMGNSATALAMSNSAAFNPLIYGTYTVTTNGLPSSLGTSDVGWNTGADSWRQPYLILTA